MSQDSPTDDEPQHSMYRRRFMQATTAAALTAAGIGTAQASAAISDGVTALAAGSPWTLSWAQRAGVETAENHDHPTWLVRHDDGETSTLRNWIGSHDDRHEVAQFDALDSDDEDHPMMAIATPAAQVGLTFRTPTDDLLSRDYVQSVDLDHVLSYTEPVDPIPSHEADEMQGIPALSQYVHGLHDFDGGLAYDDDMPVVDMQTVREVTNATSTDITLPDTSTVTVAVIDTGVNTADDDSIFGGRVLSTSKNVITGETGVAAVEDGNGHGTFCAAEIGSEAAEPYQGYAKSVDILAVKALDDEGSGSTTDIVEAIRYAADQGADVACLSLGSPVYSYELDQAVSYAAGAGMVCVVATGNDRYATRWVASPASGSDCIAVAASTGEPADEAKVGYFANHGPHSGSTDFSGGHTNGASPDLISPGCKIETKVPRADGVVDTKELTGTSMAAPDVVGGIALLYADDAGPKGDFEATYERITNGQPMPGAGVTEDGGHGMLDVSVAINDTERKNRDETDDDAAARDDAHHGLSDAQGGFIGGLFL